MAEELEGEAVFIGVSNNDTVEDGKNYVEEFGVPYAMAHASEVWVQFDDPFRPTTIVIDGSGQIATQIDGPVTYETLKAEVEKVL